MKEKRHTCIICNKYRYEKFMTQPLPISWVCNNGKCNKDKELIKLVKCFKTLEDLKSISPAHIRLNLIHYINKVKNAKH